MKTSILVMCLLSLVAMGCKYSKEERERCGEHGEFDKGHCRCELGWRGDDCAENVLELYLGTFVLASDSCGVLGWNTDTVRITADPTKSNAAIIACNGLAEPLQGSLDNFLGWSIEIEATQVYTIDSLGNRTPILIKGMWDGLPNNNFITYYADSAQCGHRFLRQ